MRLEELDQHDQRAVRAWLWSTYGRARRLPDDVGGRVLVFACGSEEAATAYAAADRDVFGHPTRVELRESVGWVSVVDLRPRLEELEGEHRRAGGCVMGPEDDPMPRPRGCSTCGDQLPPGSTCAGCGRMRPPKRTGP